MITTNFDGVTFNDLNDIYSFDIDSMNILISDYNTDNNTNYPIWDNITDDLEKFIHFLLIYCQVQQLIKSNNELNVKIVSINPNTQTWGNRNSLSSRLINVAFPFTNQSDIWGDPDNLG
jgi:uncharacterized membrane protein